jgi:hypothetical protein
MHEPIGTHGGPVKSVLPPRACPRCESERVHRSHRRSRLDRVLYALGAEIRRCHQCRYRHARFTKLAVPLADSSGAGIFWTSIAVMSTGFLVCVLLVLWIIRRFSG